DPVASPLVVGLALFDEPLERVALQACRDPMRARRLRHAALTLDRGGLGIEPGLKLLQEVARLAQLLRAAARKSAALILLEHRAHRVEPCLLFGEALLRGLQRRRGFPLRRAFEARDHVEIPSLS